jgi:Flp pilus assembly protein TadG
MERGTGRTSTLKILIKRRTDAAQAGETLRDFAGRFFSDRSGNYVMLTALMAPVLLGLVGLGTEDGVWLYTHQTMQSAADAAAFSAAENYSINGAGLNVSGSSSSLTTEADAVAAQYAFVNGKNGVTVALNLPPKSGRYKAVQNAVEVIITQVQPRLFSTLWNKGNVTITARAVALSNAAQGCVLALDPSANSAALASGSTSVNLNNCDLDDDSSNATALNGNGSAVVNARQVSVVGGATGTGNFHASMGITTGSSIIPDPYAGVSFPSFSGCDQTNFSVKTRKTIDPGVYCKGMTFNAGADVTFNPGTYYVDRGTFTVNGGASLHGTGVTIVLTSSSGSSYADVKLAGGSTLNLTAPSTGTLSGIVFFGDRAAPKGTSYKFNGDSEQVYGGAVYLPEGDVQWAGGAGTSTSCTQIIGNTITFTGNSDVAVNCNGYGTKAIGLSTKLAE